MSAEHYFTSLGDARAKTFHVWPALHSTLLAISGMYPIPRRNAHASIHTVSHAPATMPKYAMHSPLRADHLVA